MKTRMTMIAAAVALMFASANMASAATKLHEDEWGKINLYGNTTIANDSTDDWGPWKEFVQPAAGAPSVALLGGLGGELYRPLPPVASAAQESCGAGAWCGYAVYTSNLYTYDGGEYGYGHSERNRPQAGLIELVPSPDDPAEVTVLGGSGTGLMGIKITPMDGSDPLLLMPRLNEINGQSALGVPVEFGMDTTWVGTRDGLANFYGYEYDSWNGTIDGQDFSGQWNTSIGGHNRIWAQGKDTGDQYDVTPYMTMGGNLYVSVYGYVNGDYYQGYFSASDGAEGYVAGIHTPLSDMAALQAGNVTANYAGYTSGYKNTSGQSPVAVSVNFGNGTWSGSWNGGADGNISNATDSSGRPYVYGQVGLNASGTVSGASFQSTSVSALDGQVAGSVQGNFYGPQAAGLGGIVNVTKTVGEGYSNATYVDVFAAQKTTAGTPQ